jgi:hypothetical protein
MSHGPLTFVCVAALLGIAALSAIAVTGARATHLDPLVALRAE